MTICNKHGWSHHDLPCPTCFCGRPKFNSVIAFSIVDLEEVEDVGPNFRAAIRHHTDPETRRVAIASPQYLEDQIVELVTLRNQVKKIEGDDDA